MISATPPINLVAVQSEFALTGIVACSTPAGLDPLPTALLDFLGKSAATVSISAIPNLWGQSGFPAPGGCRITFKPDGTWNSISNTPVASPQNPSGNWLTPTTAGIGSSYWIRLTQTASAGRPGILTNPAVSWLNMSSDVIVTYQSNANSVGGGSRTFTIEISSSSSGSPVVVTKTGFMMTAQTTA